jgi:hypothetical protein
MRRHPFCRKLLFKRTIAMGAETRSELSLFDHFKGQTV